MDTPPSCATCRFWAGTETAYRAACLLNAVYGDPAFDACCERYRRRLTREDLQERAEGVVARLRETMARKV